MGCGNRPVLTAAEEGINELSLTPKPIGADDGSRSHGANSLGADNMSFPFYPPFSRHDTQGDCLPYQPQSQYENNRLGGYMNLNCLTDSKTEFPRVSETSYPEVSMRELCLATAGNDTIGAGNTIGSPIKAHGAEAKYSRICRPQTMGNFSSSERSTSVLPLVDNFGVTGNKNDINIVPAPICSPQEVDRNFLTLGIGGGREIRSNGDLCTQEFASKLDDVTSDRSNSSVPFPGFKTSRTDVGSNCLEKYDTSLFDPTPSSLPSESTLTAQPKYVTPTPLGTEKPKPTYFASQPISRQQDYYRKSSVNISSESSRNYRSDRHRGSSISHAQLGKLIPLTEGRGTQSSSGFRFPVSVQAGGTMTLPAEGTRTDVAHIGPFPSGAQPVGHLRTSNNAGSGEAPGNSLFPQRNGFEISRAGTFHSDATGPFPKRLGVQPNDFASARATRGPPPPYFPAQVNSFRPSGFPGQHRHDMPGQYSKDFPRVDYSTGLVLPFPKHDFRHQPSIVSHPSLKRQATENSSNARLGQRRRFIPQPVIHHFAPHQRPNIAASIPTAVHIPPVPDHVKWQGYDGPPKPTGHKCLLCKRDLSFNAEGPLYQPPIPPPVAVLSCGHTFHDHCLQLITPQDQPKEPPCIPCAVGET